MLPLPPAPSDFRRHRVLGRCAAAAIAVWLVACVDRLPMQDRRILQATPVAKLTIDDLSRDYQRDKAAADKKYWGKAIEVSGVVASTRDEQTEVTLVFADTSGTVIVEASLLEDQAKAILASTSDSRHVTLRCYCGGLSGHVLLRSCIAQ